MSITTKTILLTPALAQLYIDSIDVQRPVSKAKVSSYADQIKKGQWQLNGQSIILDSNRRLKDGQHRCHAVIEAGKAIRTILVAGVKPESFKTMDTGKNRSGSDVLSIVGAKNATTVSAGIRTIYRVLSYYEKGAVRPTNTDIVKFFEDYPEMEIIGKNCQNWYSRGDRTISSSPCVGYYWLFSNTSPDADVNEFFKQVLTGVGLTDGGVIHKLRNTISRYKGSGKSISQKALDFMMVRAWNIYVKDPNKTQVGHLYRDGANFPLLANKKSLQFKIK